MQKPSDSITTDAPGWRVASYSSPQGPGDHWKALAVWHPHPFPASDGPDYLYRGAGATKEAARADVLARCARDPKWSNIRAE